MSLFEWSDKFSVYVPEMDEQHKKLVGLLNYLHDSLLKQEKQEILSKILDELLDYTKVHFKREEELMEQNGYPCSTTQKSEHNDLVREVLEMRKKYYTGDTGIAMDLVILLNDWLAEHILIEDKKYGPYIADISVNIKELDQQHKKLINLSTVFCVSKKSHIKQEELSRLLDDLVDYTETHFKREEELMKQWEYPDYADHKSDHENLAQQVLNTKKKHVAGHENTVTAIDMLLSYNFANHIIEVDKKYGPYFNSKGIT